MFFRSGFRAGHEGRQKMLVEVTATVKRPSNESSRSSTARFHDGAGRQRGPRGADEGEVRHAENFAPGGHGRSTAV
jgi:hypothetical protein